MRMDRRRSSTCARAQPCIRCDWAITCRSTYSTRNPTPAIRRNRRRPIPPHTNRSGTGHVRPGRRPQRRIRRRLRWQRPPFRMKECRARTDAVAVKPRSMRNRRSRCFAEHRIPAKRRIGQRHPGLRIGPTSSRPQSARHLTEHRMPVRQDHPIMRTAPTLNHGPRARRPGVSLVSLWRLVRRRHLRAGQTQVR